MVVTFLPQTHTTVLRPFCFRNHLGETVPVEIWRDLLLDFFGAREDNRGRYNDHPAGCHSIHTNQRPTSINLHFYARCPSCHNPPTLSWLGTGTKYAGLHTQWRGSYPVAWLMVYLVHTAHMVLAVTFQVQKESATRRSY